MQVKVVKDLVREHPSSLDKFKSPRLDDLCPRVQVVRCDLITTE